MAHYTAGFPTHFEVGQPCWIDLGTDEPQRAVEFYSELFGWDDAVTARATRNSRDYFVCTLAGRRVAGIHSQVERSAPQPMWRVYFSVDDAPVQTDAIEAAGGTRVGPVDMIGELWSTTLFMDTTDAAFGMFEPGSAAGLEVVGTDGALAWCELVTEAPDLAKDFYQDAFGWKYRDHPIDDHLYTEWTSDGEVVGGMMRMDQRWPVGTPSHWMPYFAVADVAETATLATSLGARVLFEPREIEAGEFAVIEDPQGGPFSILTAQRSEE